MSIWIKDETITTKEEIEKIKEAFKKNKIKSAYFTYKRGYIRYKPLMNLKIFNLDKKAVEDLITFFIALNKNNAYSVDANSMSIGYENGNNVLILRNDKEAKIFYNCDKDLSQIGFEDKW